MASGPRSSLRPAMPRGSSPCSPRQPRMTRVRPTIWWPPSACQPAWSPTKCGFWPARIASSAATRPRMGPIRRSSPPACLNWWNRALNMASRNPGSCSCHASGPPPRRWPCGSPPPAAGSSVTRSASWHPLREPPCRCDTTTCGRSPTPMRRSSPAVCGSPTAGQRPPRSSALKTGTKRPVAMPPRPYRPSCGPMPTAGSRSPECRQAGGSCGRRVQAANASSSSTWRRGKTMHVTSRSGPSPPWACGGRSRHENSRKTSPGPARRQERRSSVSRAAASRWPGACGSA